MFFGTKQIKQRFLFERKLKKRWKSKSWINRKAFERAQSPVECLLIYYQSQPTINRYFHRSFLTDVSVSIGICAELWPFEDNVAHIVAVWHGFRDGFGHRPGWKTLRRRKVLEKFVIHILGVAETADNCKIYFLFLIDTRKNFSWAVAYLVEAWQRLCSFFRI